MVSYALNYAWGGEDPTGYHLVNIALHVVSSILVVLLLWQLSANRTLAFLAGVVFALHPVHTEAVNYFTARSSIFYTLWSVLSVILYVRFRRSGRLIPLLGALVSYAAALLAKEAAIVVPVLLLAYDISFRRNGLKKIMQWIRPHLGFLSVSIAFVMLRQAITGALAPAAIQADVQTLLLTFAVVFESTLRDQLLPIHLSVFHPQGYVRSIGGLREIAACGLLFVMFLGSFLVCRRLPLLSLGLLWLPVGLLPVAVLPIFTKVALYQENRGYFSTVGLMLIAGPLLAACWGEGNSRKRIPVRLLIAGLILVMGMAVTQRNVVWRDEITLWADAVQKYPGSPTAHLDLAKAHRLAGDRESATKVLERATKRLPPNPILYNDLCALYLELGALNEAWRACETAIEIYPEVPTPYFNLGTIYRRVGQPERAAEAYEAYLHLVKTQPTFGGQIQEAQSRLKELQARPASPSIRGLDDH
jgi:hypothetical protein